MSHFYGVLQGSRDSVTRCGTKSSGMDTVAAGWRGAIRVYVTEVDGADRYDIHLTPWQGSGGQSKRIAEGVLDSTLED